MTTMCTATFKNELQSVKPPSLYFDDGGRSFQVVMLSMGSTNKGVISLVAPLLKGEADYENAFFSDGNNLKIGCCSNHSNIVEDSIGGFHFSGGECYDNVREFLVCRDCGMEFDNMDEVEQARF